MLTPPVLARGGSAAATEVSETTGQRSFLAAMHMHASVSEDQGSWQGQAARMVEESVDLMFMTDHSHGLLATGMAVTLRDLDLVSRTTGVATRADARWSSEGSLELAVRTATQSRATAAVRIDPISHGNRDKLRTSVFGQTMRHTFGMVAVDDGGSYEVRVHLSHHPATRGRPAGLYQLCYRFGPGVGTSQSSERDGLTKVFELPLPVSGASVDLDLERDAATAWPDLIAADNGVQWVSFAAISPKPWMLTKVNVASVTFIRDKRTPWQVGQVQQEMADRYAAEYGIAIQPGVELGDIRHQSAFLDRPYLPVDEGLAFTDPAAYTHRNVAAVHAAGGLISWNHPFGPTMGPLLTGDAAVARRREVFRTLKAISLYGADILEVGYATRGSMGIDAHMALWDTFSRRGMFLTANGVSDSHDSAENRLRFRNEFATGIWAASVGTRDILDGLRAGRAYTRHAGFWPGGTLDLVVDDTITMGQVAVGFRDTRRLTITAENLPSGSVVEVIVGPVDYQGVDPETIVAARIEARAFAGAGIATWSLSVSRSIFVRLTVRDVSGTVIGISNPVWLLRSDPPRGIPDARRA